MHVSCLLVVAPLDLASLTDVVTVRVDPRDCLESARRLCAQLVGGTRVLCLAYDGDSYTDPAQWSYTTPPPPEPNARKVRRKSVDGNHA